MLRISVKGSQAEVVTLMLEGKVVEDTVEVLASSCEEILTAGRGLILDLSGISFVDKSGIDLIHKLASGRVKVVNSSGFVAQQLARRG